MLCKIESHICLLCVTFYLGFTYAAKYSPYKTIVLCRLCSTNYRFFVDASTELCGIYFNNNIELKTDEMAPKMFEPTATKLSDSDSMSIGSFCKCTVSDISVSLSFHDYDNITHAAK